MSWSASTGASWLTVTPASGDAPTEVTISASAAALGPGTYSTEITFTAPGAADSPVVIPVTLAVTESRFDTTLLLPVIRR